MKASAAITRHLYCHKYGNRRCKVAQSVRGGFSPGALAEAVSGGVPLWRADEWLRMGDNLENW
jgi:hypothetical protein